MTYEKAIADILTLGDAYTSMVERFDDTVDDYEHDHGLGLVMQKTLDRMKFTFVAADLVLLFRISAAGKQKPALTKTAAKKVLRRLNGTGYSETDLPSQMQEAVEDINNFNTIHFDAEVSGEADA